MERDDVIKALECCTSNSSYCGSCPYDHDFGCKPNLLKDCLSVIRELTKENARLRAHVLGQVQEALAAEYDYIETQKKHAADADAWHGLDAELTGLDRAMDIINTLMEQYAESEDAE